MKKEKQYCSICKKRISLFNKKEKRKDNEIICKRCHNKVSNKKDIIFSLNKTACLVREFNFRQKLRKEEKKFVRKMGLDYKPQRSYIFSPNEDSKILKYTLPSVSFKLLKNFNPNSNIMVNTIKIINTDNHIYLENNGEIIAELYEGTLKKYLLKNISKKRYGVEISFGQLTEKTLQLSLGIYKEMELGECKKFGLLKTNIVKTQNTKRDKNKQKLIDKLNIKDIVYLNLESNRYSIVDKDYQTLGEIPNDTKRYIDINDNIVYIGVVDQIYRCDNGLKTFDIHLMPIQIGG